MCIKHILNIFLMLMKPYILKKTKTLFVFLKAQKNWAIKLPGPWGYLGKQFFHYFFNFFSIYCSVPLSTSWIYFSYLCVWDFHICQFHIFPSHSQIRNVFCILLSFLLLSLFAPSVLSSSTLVLKWLILHHHHRQQKPTLGSLPTAVHHKGMFQIHKSQVYRPITYAWKDAS